MPVTLREVYVRRPSRRRLLQSVAALGLGVIAAALFTSAGCGSVKVPFCEGGFVRPGVGTAPATCEGLCSPSLCADANNVCVNNRCELQCASVLDCAPSQDCVSATTDGTGGGGADGGTVTICQATTFAAIGTKCPFDSGCSTIMACPDGSNCDYTQCGGATCTPNPDACDGVTKCAAGTCPDTTPCTVPGCAQSACKPLICLGHGSGDADAYCTLEDCQANTDCPTGYWCASLREPQKICGGATPNPNICGTTPATCVTTTGTTIVQGPFCAQRNVCVQHGQCDACTTDLDCSLTPDQHCTQVGSSKACTDDCSSDADCAIGFECTAGECVPRFGSCSAPAGTGTFCETCVTDADCAKGLLCSVPPSGVERVCALPLGMGAACPNDDDTECPVSPSGQHGKCMDASVESSPGDGIYETCWYPYIAASGRFDCWQGNKGVACYVNTDCISKVCKGADEAEETPGACD